MTTLEAIKEIEQAVLKSQGGNAMPIDEPFYDDDDYTDEDEDYDCLEDRLDALYRRANVRAMRPSSDMEGQRTGPDEQPKG